MNGHARQICVAVAEQAAEAWLGAADQPLRYPRPDVTQCVAGTASRLAEASQHSIVIYIGCGPRLRLPRGMTKGETARGRGHSPTILAGLRSKHQEQCACHRQSPTAMAPSTIVCANRRSAATTEVQAVAATGAKSLRHANASRRSSHVTSGGSSSLCADSSRSVHRRYRSRLLVGVPRNTASIRMRNISFATTAVNRSKQAQRDQLILRVLEQRVHPLQGRVEGRKLEDAVFALDIHSAIRDDEREQARERLPAIEVLHRVAIAPRGAVNRIKGSGRAPRMRQGREAPARRPMNPTIGRPCEQDGRMDAR